MKPKEGIGLDSTAISSLGGFLMGLVNAAKDWQDRLQSTLPGYRERIASVYLTEDEGGLNLDMKPDVIKKLVGYGEGGTLATGVSLDPAVDEEPFDFDEHRWRRVSLSSPSPPPRAFWSRPRNPGRRQRGASSRATRIKIIAIAAWTSRMRKHGGMT